MWHNTPFLKQRQRRSQCLKQIPPNNQATKQQLSHITVPKGNRPAVLIPTCVKPSAMLPESNGNNGNNSTLSCCDAAVNLRTWCWAHSSSVGRVDWSCCVLALSHVRMTASALIALNCACISLEHVASRCP